MMFVVGRFTLAFSAVWLWLMTYTLPLVSAQVSPEGHRTFADSLTEALYTNDNECTSCWGVSMMFDLLRPGGTDATVEELCGVLSLCGSLQQLLWRETVSRLVDLYDGSCTDEFTNSNGETECFANAPTLEVANSIWIDTASELTSSYSAVVGEFVQQTDFTDQGAGATVNAWVNASTRGLIDSIVEDGPLYPPYVLMALNSIYLKAQWAKPFSERFTNQDTFYTSVSREVALEENANFMHMVEFFPYSHDAVPGYQILKLRYESSDLFMIVVLPMTTNAASVSSAEVVTALPMLQSTRMALALPKFKFESKYQDNLENALKSIGLLAPFDANEGFCSIFELSCQYLDLIVQKTVIDVNEFGTVAAAATVGGLVPVSAPIDVPVLFMADHPFQFFIYDEQEDLVFFEGRVAAPEVVNESPAELQAVHSDAGFWTSNFGMDPTIPIATSRPPSSTLPPTAPPSTFTTAPPSTSATAPPGTSTTAPPSTSTTAPPNTSTTAPPNTSTTAPPSVPMGETDPPTRPPTPVSTNQPPSTSSASVTGADKLWDYVVVTVVLHFFL